MLQSVAASPRSGRSRKEKKRNYAKEYRLTKPNYGKEYYIKNKKTITDKNKIYQKNKLKTDNLYKLTKIYGNDLNEKDLNLIKDNNLKLSKIKKILYVDKYFNISIKI